MMEYKQLYEHYYTMVYRLSLLLLKNTQDAEDAVQSIFLKVMEKQPDFMDEDHTRAWLLTVTRNYCRDVQRSFWHRHRTDLEHIPEPVAEPFDRQESLLFEIFQSLPKKQREAVYLYYFEDYSIREISQILDRNESTVQSQLFAARKRMKKQFSTLKTATLILCLAATLGFSGVVADAASGGKVSASIREFFSIGLSEEESQIAEETLTLPVEVYASELVAIDENFLVLANERGLLIYDRNSGAVAAALDLQEIECNYFNADTLVTHVFQDDGKLYLFNEHVESAHEEEIVSVSAPDFAYVYDMSKLDEMKNQNYNQELIYEKTDLLVRISDKEEIQTIYKIWKKHEPDFKDTFDEFQGAEFLDKEYEKYSNTIYSKTSLLWTNKSGKKLLSCLTTDSNSTYKLYTKQPDGTFTCEPLSLILVTDSESGKDNAVQTEKPVEPRLLPEFVYTGDDAVIETLCAYLIQMEEENQFYVSENDSVYIPAPLIYDTVKDEEDLIVFCNLWSFTYYRNGNMLVCESGGEDPARLRLHPNENEAGGYEVVEDLHAGDGQMYAEDIREFCKDYPGMEEKYYSVEYDREEIRWELIKMYVEDNNLSIKYYKDYGWDPVLIE